MKHRKLQKRVGGVPMRLASKKAAKQICKDFLTCLQKKFLAKGAICTALSFAAHELFSLARCLRRRANEKEDNEQPRKFQGGLMKTG